MHSARHHINMPKIILSAIEAGKMDITMKYGANIPK